MTKLAMLLEPVALTPQKIKAKMPLPMKAPTTWAQQYKKNSFQVISPLIAMAKDTAGLA